MIRTVRQCTLLMALSACACAPAGHVYETGNFLRPHPTQELCASRGQVLDMKIEDCVTPPPPPSGPAVATAYSDQVETFEQGKAWRERIERGACSRIRDARTDTSADIADCNRDHAMRPLCIGYQGFAYVWFDLAENPVPGGVSSVAYQTNVINNLGSTQPETAAPYEQSPQYRAMLLRLLYVAFSPARKKWGSTREQFSNHAYKICVERRPF